ncbi:MAG: hypothetical protein TR69_WS6001000132 [candidate division WS6 bacterium OLB20]|uniref:Uncharacterized protein n=1 Tax=candidate division WS6 bacterium OLB20 TaxID=1617426 RepID=A0A136M027_9BACT|nr:MAG: hypothetical protein TR69_WS6001000132 [candidate division WS6 bacterium OLB20]
MTEALEFNNLPEVVIHPDSIYGCSSLDFYNRVALERASRTTVCTDVQLQEAQRMYLIADDSTLHQGAGVPEDYHKAPAADDTGVYMQHRGTYAGIALLKDWWARAPEDAERFSRVRPEFQLSYLETMARRDKHIQNVTMVYAYGDMLRMDSAGRDLQDVIDEADALKQEYPAAAWVQSKYAGLGFTDALTAGRLFSEYNGVYGQDAQVQAGLVVRDLLGRGVLDSNDHDFIVSVMNGYTEEQLADHVDAMNARSMSAVTLLAIESGLHEWGFDSVYDFAEFTDGAFRLEQDSSAAARGQIEHWMAAFSDTQSEDPLTSFRTYQYLAFLASKQPAPDNAWAEMLRRLGIPTDTPRERPLSMSGRITQRRIGMFFSHMNETYSRFGYKRSHMELFSEMPRLFTRRGLKNVLTVLADKAIA